MSFATTIYYTNKSPEYLYSVESIDVLPNGFFRIIDDENTYLLNPNTVERIEASNEDE